jgi:cytochrome c oxidase cbb3-type subunit 3
MRLLTLLFATSLLLLAAGCHSRQQTSIAAGATSISGSAVGANTTVTDAVGPIPGAPEEVHYRINPYGTDPVALQDGRRLFDWYNCSGCHGSHAGGGMGPSLRDPVWLYGNRDDQIFNSIAQGRSKGMPAWGSKIPEQQIWELVAYIKSMGTPLEPDPPIEPSHEKVPNPMNNTVLGVGTQTQAGRR